MTAVCSACAQIPLPSPIPPHPRLIVSASDWDRLRTQVKADPLSARLLAIMEAQSRQFLAEPPLERIVEGRRLLAVSRQALERISILAATARVTGNADYTKRAVSEMLALSRFSDWHPEHYLDTAEMALAVALGYDWLYDQISPADRAQIETALLEKGIAPSFDPKSSHWITAKNNWNQVCHAGMSAAAIALADRQPDQASRVLNRAIQNVPIAGRAYAPDGAFPEGPMYWHYATDFHVLLVAALERFYGSAQGLDALPGFAQTPLYIREMAAPSGNDFNYSDAQPGGDFSIALFWFARRYRHAEWLEPAKTDRELRRFEATASKAHATNRLLPFLLIWRDPSLLASTNSGTDALPLQWMGRGLNPVAVHRSGLDPAAVFVAMKGGGPSVSHGHMDSGTFVLEADGVRWALDLGMEDYHRVEQMKINLWDSSQNSQRWELFRLGPESHNILRFNGAKQLVKGNAPIVRFQSEGAHGGTVLDLTPLYTDQVASAHRGVRLLPSRAVLFQDEWTAADQPVEAGWQWVTKAEVVVKPGAVELRQSGKTLTLRILEPADAQVEVHPAQALQKAADSDNPGVSRIVIKTRTAAQENGAFRILALPGSCAGEEAPAKESLQSWPGVTPEDAAQK